MSTGFRGTLEHSETISWAELPRRWKATSETFLVNSVFGITWLKKSQLLLFHICSKASLSYCLSSQITYLLIQRYWPYSMIACCKKRISTHLERLLIIPESTKVHIFLVYTLHFHEVLLVFQRGHIHCAHNELCCLSHTNHQPRGYLMGRQALFDSPWYVPYVFLQ